MAQRVSNRAFRLPVMPASGGVCASFYACLALLFRSDLQEAYATADKIV